MRNLNFYGLSDLCPSTPKIDFSDVSCRDDSELNRLCKLVYASNSVTGLPTSDLTILFSDSVPADIASWVRQNLQSPHDLQGVSSIMRGQQVDDDTILALTRSRSESASAYIDRVNSYLIELNKKGSN